VSGDQVWYGPRPSLDPERSAVTRFGQPTCCPCRWSSFLDPPVTRTVAWLKLNLSLPSSPVVNRRIIRRDSHVFFGFHHQRKRAKRSLVWQAGHVARCPDGGVGIPHRPRPRIGRRSGRPRSEVWGTAITVADTGHTRVASVVGATELPTNGPAGAGRPPGPTSTVYGTRWSILLAAYIYNNNNI